MTPRLEASTAKVCKSFTTRLLEQTCFKAGQLANALPAWREITTDRTILEFVQRVKIEFKNCETPTTCGQTRRSRVFNKSQHSIVEEEIYKLLEKGVIKVSSPEPGEFISSIFLRPKPDGSHRVILNLKQFNEFVEYYHFKMDTLETAITMMKPG